MGTEPSTVKDVAIYLNRTGTCRNYHVQECSLEIYNCYKVVMNGVVYWKGNQRADGSYSILTCDLECGVLRKIEVISLPEYNDHAWMQVPYPVVMGESLGVLVVGVPEPVGGAPIVVDVWVMKEYGIEELWTRQISVKLPHNGSNSIVSCGNRQLICEPWAKYQQGNTVYMFDPITTECRQVLNSMISCAYSDGNPDSAIDKAYIYTESGSRQGKKLG